MGHLSCAHVETKSATVPPARSGVPQSSQLCRCCSPDCKFLRARTTNFPGALGRSWALSGAPRVFRMTSRTAATPQTVRRLSRSSPPSAQDGQGAPLDGPRWPPYGLRGPQNAPRGPQEANIMAFTLVFEGLGGFRVSSLPTLRDGRFGALFGAS